MERTIWTDLIARTYPALTRDIETEVVVIGGGLAGLMTAEALCRAGHRVAVLEADCIGGGETARSSAMVSFAHDFIYDRLIAKHGVKKAGEYLKLNKRGLDIIRECVRNYRLDCDWHDCDMYLFATTAGGLTRLETEQKAYAKLGQEAGLCELDELPFKVLGALKIPGQGRLNPYKFVSTLAKALTSRGVEIYEGVRVDKTPDDGVLEVGDFKVTAEKFVVATHYPYIDVPGWYFMKMYQSRSYNVAFRTDVKLDNIYESIEDEGFEYRQIEPGVVMCGGAPVRTGKQKSSSYDKVISKIGHTFGMRADGIVRKFSAQDCITLDLLPFVGDYGGTAGGVYVITGFNKWGFTTAAAGAELLADKMCGRERENIFSPSRLYMLKAPIKAMKNLGVVIGEYTGTLFGAGVKRSEDAELHPGDAVLVSDRGKRTGLYMNHGGEVDAAEAKCTHLGCGLKWNGDEKSWDCPCHGSRFSTKGSVISGPATEALNTGDKDDV